MDLRKVTCSECKSHLHYMENMSVKKNGVTMHFGDRFCMGRKEAPESSDAATRKSMCLPGVPSARFPASCVFTGSKALSSGCCTMIVCEQLGTDISPLPSAMLWSGELHTPLTPREFAKRCNEEPDAETLGVAVHRHYVVEIDDGIKPEFFYKTQNGYVLLGLFDAATARKNVKEDTD